MKSFKVVAICLSCTVVNAQYEYEEQYWRRGQLQYDNGFGLQQRELLGSSEDSWNLGDYLESRDAESLDDLEFEISQLLRRQDLFRVLREGAKKAKEKAESGGGGDSNSNEGTSGGGEEPKEESSDDDNSATEIDATTLEMDSDEPNEIDDGSSD